VTDKISPKTSNIYSTLFEKRHSSDYEDFVYYDVETVEILYTQAYDFLETIEKLLVN